QGLRGAAANSYGIVTGRSLADWLRQSQLGWLDDSDRSNPDVSKEPSIVDDDVRLVFARGTSPPEFGVTLHLPPGTFGARLWSGSPPSPGDFSPIVAGITTLRLKPGL